MRATSEPTGRGECGGEGGSGGSTSGSSGGVILRLSSSASSTGGGGDYTHTLSVPAYSGVCTPGGATPYLSSSSSTGSVPFVFLRGEVFEHALLTPVVGGSWGLDALSFYLISFSRYLHSQHRNPSSSSLCHTSSPCLVSLHDWLSFNQAWKGNRHFGLPSSSSSSPFLSHSKKVSRQSSSSSSSSAFLSSSLTATGGGKGGMEDEEIHLYWHLFIAILKLVSSSISSSSSPCHKRKLHDGDLGGEEEGEEKRLSSLSSSSSLCPSMHDKALSALQSLIEKGLTPKKKRSSSFSSSQRDPGVEESSLPFSCSFSFSAVYSSSPPSPDEVIGSAPPSSYAWALNATNRSVLENSLKTAHEREEKIDIRLLSLLLLIQECRSLRVPLHPRTTDDPWRSPSPSSSSSSSPALLQHHHSVTLDSSHGSRDSLFFNPSGSSSSLLLQAIAPSNSSTTMTPAGVGTTGYLSPSPSNRGESPRYVSREAGVQGVADEGRLRTFLYQALPSLVHTVVSTSANPTEEETSSLGGGDQQQVDRGLMYLKEKQRGRGGVEDEEEEKRISKADVEVFSLLFACCDNRSLVDAFTEGKNARDESGGGEEEEGGVAMAEEEGEGEQEKRCISSASSPENQLFDINDFIAWLRRRLVWNDRFFPSRQSLSNPCAFVTSIRRFQFARVFVVNEIHGRRIVIDDDSISGGGYTRDQVLLLNCTNSDILISASNLSAVKLVNCSNSSLICTEPIKVFLSLFNSRRMEVHAPASLVQVSNTLDGQLYLCCGSPPLLCGDTRGIVLAPLDCPLPLTAVKKKKKLRDNADRKRTDSGQGGRPFDKDERNEDFSSSCSRLNEAEDDEEEEEQYTIFGRPLSEASTSFAFPLCGGGCGMTPSTASSSSSSLSSLEDCSVEKMREKMMLSTLPKSSRQRERSSETNSHTAGSFLSSSGGHSRGSSHGGGGITEGKNPRLSSSTSTAGGEGGKAGGLPSIPMSSHIYQILNPKHFNITSVPPVISRRGMSPYRRSPAVSRSVSTAAVTPPPPPSSSSSSGRISQLSPENISPSLLPSDRRNLQTGDASSSSSSLLPASCIQIQEGEEEKREEKQRREEKGRSGTYGDEERKLLSSSSYSPSSLPLVGGESGDSLLALPEDFLDALIEKQHEISSLQEVISSLKLTKSQSEKFTQILSLMLHDFCKRHSSRSRRLISGQFLKHEEFLRSRELSAGSTSSG